ncbi:MAG: type II secretion system secretin GspD [Alphaproteobacteria bacterium]|nr:type II secretion system secretin GspD [Alphaproteobacteria bacterium]MCB9793435.1 type II secretion system secretin GspD [Alphaproteobacteria bacterium]
MKRLLISGSGLLLLAALALGGPVLAQDDEPAADDEAGDEVDGPVRPVPIPQGVRPGALPGNQIPRALGGPDGAPNEPRGPTVEGGGPVGPPPPTRAVAQKEDDEEEEEAPATTSSKPSSTTGGGNTANLPGSDRNKPPCLDPSAMVTIDFVDANITDLVKYFAEISCKNFILSEELKGEITIISHSPVTVASAYEAFLAALSTAGYTTVRVGDIYKVVPTNKASSNPVSVYEGDYVSSTSGFVTQIFQLENVSVSDISSVAKELAGSDAKIIAYAPTNTLIITDQAVNIRRMWKVVGQLDVAAPRSALHIVHLQYAEAADVQGTIEEIYGTEEKSSASSSSSNRASTSAAARRRRNRRTAEPEATEASASSVGSEGAFISKIVADERTNSLIILANESAFDKVMELIQELDVDVDPASRAQIHVVYLEHAKAEDVAQVLSNLSQDGGNRSSTQRNLPARNARNQQTDGDGGSPDTASATALLDDNVRVTSDENTNSLVIVAPPEAFDILEQVIKQLDIRRKQVFVEVVIMELASEDTFELGVGAHVGKDNDLGGVSIGSAQLGGSSLGLSTDLLSGLAMGVFSEAIDVAVSDPTTGQSTTLSIPAFGVALNALQANSKVNILSTPNVLTLDNEEAKVIVGRNIPFPVSSGRDSNNNPLITYQREDVAITLQVTPQINESDYVTLEVFQEVTDVEEDSQGLDVTSAGFITSVRSAETTVLVKDNQTIVIGGLMGQTTTKVETKVPILGDIPLIGALFRGKREVSRKTNLLIFLTPHVINEPADLEEVYRVKVAQREEFLRRFYGKSEVEQLRELNELLSYSMNVVDEPSAYRTKVYEEEATQVTIGSDGSPEPGDDWEIEEVYPEAFEDPDAAPAAPAESP